MADSSYEALSALAASDSPNDVRRAHERSLTLMTREPLLRVVAAMAYDRTRAFAGRAQKFGTQSVLAFGERVLWPVDPGTTDSERAKWMLKSLADLRAQAEQAPIISKQHLRAVARLRRQSLASSELAAFGEQIAEHGAMAVDCLGEDVIAAYWPLPGEVDPRALAQRLAERSGARLALPVVSGEEMEFHEWREEVPLEPAGFGTMGPARDAKVLRPSIVLTPLVAFDASGGRLGQGKGYYDRKLMQLAAGHVTRANGPLVVGVACSCQELPVVPTERHDRPLDLLVTELGSQSFAR